MELMMDGGKESWMESLVISHRWSLMNVTRMANL